MKLTLIALILLACAILGAQAADKTGAGTTHSPADSTAVSVADSVGYRPGDRELLLWPTATTLPKGHFSYTNYYIFMHDLTLSPMNKLEVGVVFIPSGMNIWTGQIYYHPPSVHVKWHFYSRKKIDIAAYTMWSSGLKSLLISSIFSYDAESLRLYFSPALAYTGFDGKALNILYHGGVSYRPWKHFSFMVEYLSANAWDEVDLAGGLMYGWRWNGKYAQIDLGAIQRNATDFGDLSPILKFSWTLKP
ncbi:MAG: hypothetical protein K8R90_03295 [Candidatus Cloacimonetes bacterium]|nr:hypothetical protein [Candidatus Cloacimonadota bacterium]